MQCNGFDRKMILDDLKKNIFLNPKGGAFGSEKTVFAVQGGNFSKKKNSAFLEVSQICLRMA